jgi:phosphonate transport system substrate-binding protein
MPPITLAVVPSVTPGDSRAALDALCAALGSILDTPVRSAQPASYGELALELEKDRVQFAWMPPVLLVLTDERIRIRPLVSAVRGDRTDYRSVLFVDAESPVLDVEELRGKTVAWVDATSASGYFYPRMHLAALGVDPKALFGHELFLRSHAEVVRAVFDGRADAGATYAERPPDGQPITRAGFCDVFPDRPARVLEWTRPIPSDVIAGHGLLPKDQLQAFSNAILTLAGDTAGRTLLYNAFHAERFVPTPRTAMRQLWDLVSIARNSGLLLQL